MKFNKMKFNKIKFSKMKKVIIAILLLSATIVGCEKWEPDPEMLKAAQEWKKNGMPDYGVRSDSTFYGLN